MSPLGSNDKSSIGPSQGTGQVEATASGGVLGRDVRRYRSAAIVIIALVVALIIGLVIRDSSDASSGSAKMTYNVKTLSEASLKSFAASVGHPIYWLGARKGVTYELGERSDGSIYIRYLPAGVAAGASQGYLTVATYPFPGAYAAIQTVSKQDNVPTVAIAGDGIAEAHAVPTSSVHAAYPGVDYQIEVFDPTPGTAAKLVKGGQLAAIGAASKPEAVTPARLRALAASLEQPIYWVGKRKGYTLELVQKDGQILIRYLPPGVHVGATGLFLTIGTYRYPKALTAVQGLAKQWKRRPIKLPGGGIAVIDGGRPQNIHLAYPGSGYQIEVFDPSPATAKRVVTSGQLQKIG